jgi:MFS family permease
MRWRILPLMLVFVALAHFNRLSISVAGTEKLIRKDFISETQMGLVYSSFLFLYTAFMMPGGWFIDRYGPRAAWMLVGFGSTMFVALTGVAGQLWSAALPLWASLLVVRALLGCTSAPLHPTGARLVGNWIPPSGASLANGLITGAACVGMASTFLVFGQMMETFGWPGAFQVSGAVTLIVALAWTVLGADHPSGAPAERPKAEKNHERSLFDAVSIELGHFIKMLKNRSLLFLTLSYAALGYFQYLFFYWSQYYFEEIKNLSKATSRSYASTLTLAMGAGMILGGLLSDRMLSWVGPRLGLKLIPICGLVVSAYTVLLGLQIEEIEAVLFLFAVAMAAAGMCEGASWTASVMIGSSRGGTAAGIMNTGGNAGGMLAPTLTPLISSFFNWQVGLGVGSVVCLLGAVLWLWVDPSDRFHQLESDDEPEA